MEHIQNPGPPRTSARVSGTEGLPQFSARSQRCESTEVCEGARGRPSLRHVASSGTEVFVQRAGEGRQERGRRDDTLSRECLPLHGLVQSTRFGLRMMTFSQVQPSKKKPNEQSKTKDEPVCKFGLQFLSARLIHCQFLSLPNRDANDQSVLTPGKGTAFS